MNDFKWVKKSERTPESTVLGGRDIDASEIIVGRAMHESVMMPAKVIPSKDIAFVSWEGKEHKKQDYEILCEKQFIWEPSNGGLIPEHAVSAGTTAEGDTLYVGRANHEGRLIVGRLQRGQRELYIPFNGEEKSYVNYEVLTFK